MNRRSNIALLLAVLTLTFTATGAAGSEPRLDGPNVVEYREPAYEFAESTTSIVQGSRTEGGGCSFTMTNTLAPGETATAVERAYDPDTCRFLIEMGTLANPEEPPGPPKEATTSSGEAAASSDGQSSPTALQAAGRRLAYSETWFHDPVPFFQFRVNGVRNEVEWTPGGSCTMAPGTIGWMRYRLDWLALTGWYLESHRWDNSGDIVDCGESILSRSTAHFQNDAFCTDPGPPPFVQSTHTWYEPNAVEGFGDGSARVTWSVRKEGVCSVFINAAHTEGNVGI